MQIICDFSETPHISTLRGAPANAIVEVRVQDLMSGTNVVEIVECDANGNAGINVLARADQASFNVYVRTLDDNNEEKLTHLVTTQDSDDRIVFITEDAYVQSLDAPTTPTPIAPKAAPQEVTTADTDGAKG